MIKGDGFSDDVWHEVVAPGYRIAWMPASLTPPSPLLLAAWHVEISAKLAREAGNERAFSELVEIAIELCPAHERDAMAGRFGIVLANTAGEVVA